MKRRFDFSHDYDRQASTSKNPRKSKYHFGYQFNCRILEIVRDPHEDYDQRFKFARIVRDNLIEMLEVRPLKHLLLENKLETFIAEFNNSVKVLIDEIDAGVACGDISLLNDAHDANNPGMLMVANKYVPPITQAESDPALVEAIISSHAAAVSQASFVFRVWNENIAPIHFLEDDHDAVHPRHTIYVYPQVAKLMNDYLFPVSDELATDQKWIAHNYFEELKSRNMLIHVPYDSYSMVTDFIDEMCTHSQITHIGITLYRVASDSVIVKSLTKAARLGKQVFVYIEVSAKGDQFKNALVYRYLSQFENITIMCTSFGRKKTHAKLFYAVDRAGNQYHHFGTGNYNETTARVYTDLHHLGRNGMIGQYLIPNFFRDVFHRRAIRDSTSMDYQCIRMTENSCYGAFNPIYPKLSQLDDVRGTIYQQIMRAITNNLQIRIKCNNIDDDGISECLAQAAAQHPENVKIIVRTTNAVEDTDSVQKSIIGKYLEHERMYIFGDSSDPKSMTAYISSADLLWRNLSKRHEAIIQVDQSVAIELEQIFESCWTGMES